MVRFGFGVALIHEPGKGDFESIKKIDAIAKDRLSTIDYGASRPKESNDTLAGRARNRRVELVKR